MIDPTKEVPAKRDQIRAGLISQQDALLEQGYEPEDLLEEAEEWRGEVDGRGLVFDTDVAAVPSVGSAKPDDKDDDADKDDEEDE